MNTKQLEKVIDGFRELYSEMTANQIKIFLVIANNPNIIQYELSLKSRCRENTVSRTKDLLLRLGLIQVTQSTTGRVRHYLNLSPEGSAFLKKLLPSD